MCGRNVIILLRAARATIAPPASMGRTVQRACDPTTAGRSQPPRRGAPASGYAPAAVERRNLLPWNGHVGTRRGLGAVHGRIVKSKSNKSANHKTSSNLTASSGQFSYSSLRLLTFGHALPADLCKRADSCARLCLRSPERFEPPSLPRRFLQLF